ncbi:glycosyltransferase [Gramella sp. GC03-9]|uniref:Glycosyltransferase n=1 Tax=Christiangramia oceanisediminis TaxID=2920386 RepID=A0A9X2I866_9FLAO|nr:glycosyltransferase family 2 protein [Gramella oceanisediminis]MCP9199584.1 glycosyltransferase [Gramella oceanisediminis]
MKISIITVVYNNVDTISECIRSVLNQSYKNIELVIIDGGSSDGTQKEIEKFQDKLGYYISEKDKGIFDAYNKGIRKASGDVIGILNSDDLLFGNETIARIVAAFSNSNAHLVYGHGMYIGKRNSKLIKRIYSCRKFRKGFLKYGWIPLHPTIYVKKEVYQKHGWYSLDYSIASDYDMSLRWFEDEHLKKEFLNEWIVKMRMGGKSTTLNLQKRKSTEDLDIIQKHRLLGVFTLFCKIGRKVPQYVQPRFMNFDSILKLPVSLER